MGVSRVGWKTCVFYTNIKLSDCEFRETIITKVSSSWANLFHSKWPKLSFWVKIVFLSVAQLVTTVIFFSAWDKSPENQHRNRGPKLPQLDPKLTIWEPESWKQAQNFDLHKSTWLSLSSKLWDILHMSIQSHYT